MSWILILVQILLYLPDLFQIVKNIIDLIRSIKSKDIRVAKEREFRFKIRALLREKDRSKRELLVEDLKVFATHVARFVD